MSSKSAIKKTAFLPFELGVGGAKGDRTPDLIAASDALSQLSYGPISIVKDYYRLTNRTLYVNIFCDKK